MSSAGRLLSAVAGTVFPLRPQGDAEENDAKANDSKYSLASSVSNMDGGPAAGALHTLTSVACASIAHPPIAEMKHGGLKHSGHGKDL